MELRAIRPGEVAAFVTAAETAFHEDASDDDIARHRITLEPQRALAVFDDERPVATAAVYSRELTVPGTTVPAACVTQVGVLATHRRRGLLTRLMRRQLDDIRRTGEAVAVLWATS